MFEEIKKQFCEVISYSQSGITDPKVDELFDSWYQAKKSIIDILGGLIWEQEEPVSVYLNPADRLAKVENFAKYAKALCGNEELENFLQQNSSSFFANRVSVPFGKIPRGAKLVKSLRAFEISQEQLNDLQSKASQVIQESKLEGRLCISVHPLDYLSSSENTYKWHSCHNLAGEYRAGNLSYMVDDCTVVCYIKGADGVKLPAFPTSVPWNSKKWRTLVHIAPNKELVWAGRSYPINNEDALEIVRRRLSKLLKKEDDLFNFSSFSEESIAYAGGKKLKDRYYEIRGRLFSRRDVIRRGERSLNYNDLLDSVSYVPRLSIKSGYGHDIYPDKGGAVTLGGAVKCLCCEQEYIDFPETMMCTPCELLFGDSDGENVTFCAGCNVHIESADGNWVEGDQIVCEVCYEDYDKCDICGGSFLMEDLIWDSQYRDTVCSHCMNFRQEYLED